MNARHYRNPRLLRASRHIALVLALSAALFGWVGCGSNQRISSVHSFRLAPSDWLELDSGGKQHPARGLEVADQHLNLSGSHVLLDPTKFSSFEAQVDVAMIGGRPDGFSGLYVRAADDPSNYYTVAVRGSGDWRFYKTRDARKPSGGRSWQKAEQVGGFRRLSMRVRDGRGEFFVDGKSVARASLASNLSGGETRWQIGIVNVGLQSRWNNFIAGDQGAFESESLVNWGGGKVADRLFAEFKSLAVAHKKKASRSRILHMAAAYEGALKCSDSAGGARYRSEFEVMRPGLFARASDIGEDALFDKCFPPTAGTDFADRAREAVKEGRRDRVLVYSAAALRLEDSSEMRGLLVNGLADLSELQYRLEFDAGDVDAKILSERQVLDIVRRSYGGLKHSRKGRLVISVDVEKSIVDSEKETNALREIPVLRTGEGLSLDLDSELKQLEEQYSEELEDARYRARHLRAGGVVQEPGSDAEVKKIKIGSRTYRLCRDDGRRLIKIYKKLSAKKSERRAADASVIRIEKVPAERISVSILLEVSIRLEYEGETLIEVDNFRSYRGIELWSHPANHARGVPQSRARKSDRDAAIALVKSRVLRRIQTAISREGAALELSDEDRFLFLLRIARSSRRSEDVESLRWYLQQAYDFLETDRDLVTKRLLER